MARQRAVHDLVKCLETYVGGNVKVSEWPIQCTVASGRTGPHDLSLYLFGTFGGTEKRRGGEARRQVGRSSAFPAKCRLTSSSRSIRLDRKRRRPGGRKSIFNADTPSQRDTPGLQRVTSPLPSLSRFRISKISFHVYRVLVK